MWNDEIRVISIAVTSYIYHFFILWGSAGVLGGEIGSFRGEYGDVILGSAGGTEGLRMRRRSILQKKLVSGMETLKVLELSSRIWGPSSGFERTSAKI